MLLRIALLVVITCLGGCDRLSATFQSRTDKVTAAFPPPDEVQFGYKALLDSMETDSAERKRIEEQYANLLQVRALTCGASASVGRFDTVADVRSRLSQPGCFSEQNLMILDWVGMRRLARIAAATPLVAPSGLPPKLVLPQTEPIGDVSIASAAGVLVLRNGRGQVTVHQLPDGKVLNSFQETEGGPRPASLSPNGRLLAVPLGSGNGLKMIDTATGNTIWRTTNFIAVTSWLPEIHATLLARRSPSAPALLDHESGRADAYPLPLTAITWSLNLPDPPGRRLLGDGQTMALMAHARNADGTLSVQAMRQWRLGERPITSGHPMLLKNSRRVAYLSMRDLAWHDLDSNDSGAWPLTLLGAHAFTKVSDHQIAMDVTLPGLGRSMQVLDLQEEALAPALNSDPAEGQLTPLAGHTGVVRRAPQSVTLMAQVETGPANQKLDKLLGEVQLAQQLAKLQSPMSAPVHETMQRPDVAALAAQRAADAAAAAYGQRPYSPPPAAVALPADTGVPMLRHLPANTQVSGIGVYEPVRAPGANRGQRSPVTVRVEAASAPLVLVLSSYHAVEWDIRNEGRPIAAILLAGQGESTVKGVQARVVNIGRHQAYRIESPEFLQLKRAVAAYVAPPLQVFQGRYSGSEFSVPAF